MEAEMAVLTDCSARLDAAIGLSGLFLSLPDANKDTGIARTIRQKWKGGRVVIMGRLMGAFQQDILFALLAEALRVGEIAAPGAEMLADGYEEMGRADRLDVISVRMSYPRLAELAGHKNSTKFRMAARDALQMLAGVTVRGEGADESFAVQRLVAGVAGEGRKGVNVTINWRLTLAVLGRGIYGVISLAERHRLNKTERIAHAWIACWLGAKSQNSIGVAKLAGHIFPSSKKPSERTVRYQLAATRKALLAIGELAGWEIAIDGQDTAHIKRAPALPRGELKNSTSIAAKQSQRCRSKTMKPSTHAGLMEFS